MDKSTGEIAVAAGVPIHRVVYVARSRKIVPTRRVGNYRFFDESGVKAIKAVLDEIGKRKSLGAAG